MNNMFFSYTMHIHTCTCIHDDIQPGNAIMIKMQPENKVVDVYKVPQYNPQLIAMHTNCNNHTFFTHNLKSGNLPTESPYMMFHTWDHFYVA